MIRILGEDQVPKLKRYKGIVEDFALAINQAGVIDPKKLSDPLKGFVALRKERLAHNHTNKPFGGIDVGKAFLLTRVNDFRHGSFEIVGTYYIKRDPDHATEIHFHDGKVIEGETHNFKPDDDCWEKPFPKPTKA